MIPHAPKRHCAKVLAGSVQHCWSSEQGTRVASRKERRELEAYAARLKVCLARKRLLNKCSNISRFTRHTCLLKRVKPSLSLHRYQNRNAARTEWDGGFASGNPDEPVSNQ